MRGAGRKKLGDPDPSEDQPGSPNVSHQNDQENYNFTSSIQEANKEDTNNNEGVTHNNGTHDDVAGEAGDNEEVIEGVELLPSKVNRPVARRGRAGSGRKRTGSNDGGDEDESAYSESEESAYDESSEDYESEASEEYDSDDEDYDDDEGDYGRDQKNRGGRSSGYSQYQYQQHPGNFYNQWMNRPPPPMMMGGRPMMPMPFPGQPMLAPRPLPPLVHAAMPSMVRAMNAQPGAKPALTAAQLQEIARNTVASLVGGQAVNLAPPPAQPQAPKQDLSENSDDKSAEAKEGTEDDKNKEMVESSDTSKVPEEIKATVSDEIKQNLTQMLTDPQWRAVLMQKLYANQMAKIAAANGGQIPPNMLSRPPMMPMQPMPGYYPPMRPFSHPMRPAQQPSYQRQHKKEKRLRQPMKYDGDNDDAPIATRRATRSAAKKVDFSRLYQEEDHLEAEIQKYAELQDTGELEAIEEKERLEKAKRHDDLSEIAPAVSKPGRKGRKSKQSEDYDEDELFDELVDYEQEEVEDGADSKASSDDEPTVGKILSCRKSKSGDEEFLVKFNGLSYLHIEWISREEMEEQKMGANRIKKFLSKPLSDHHYDDRNIFNPDYLQVDRIVYGWEHPTVEDPNVWTASYLVKWKSLPYEESSWEKIETLREKIPNISDKLSEYETRPKLESRRDPQQLRIGQRPDKSAWQAMPESPMYKNDNQLRSYQLEGVNWLVYCWINKQSCIIADEMGLGKTVQSVAFIELLKSQFRVPGPYLVVAPLSTIPHWEREFSSWTNLNVLVYHGTVKSRDMMHEYEFYFKDDNDRVIPNVYRFDVLITTYEMAQAGFDTLQPIIWRAGIFDEAHRLKNRSSKASEVLSLFRLEHKVMLTGTPLQNNLEELFALLHFLQPGRFASEETFLEEYGNLQRSEDVQKLQELLRPLMLRRLKEDVEKSIPVKEETVVEVELTALQKRYYRAILEKNFAFLTKGCRGNNAPNLVNTMMELRKCCIHPYLIKGSEERILAECGAVEHEAVMNCMIQASGKLVLVDKLLKKLREQGHKVLIFSQMTRCLDLLSDFLAYRGYPWERIDGAVKGEDRQAAIDRYCNPNSDSFVFLLCTRAGGVGINLTVADTVVIFDSDWNPQNDLQAQARCHRIGQEKSVKVYRLITRNTYEREMFDKAGLKLGLDRAILQRMNNLEDGNSLVGTHAPQLSKKEVETLLKKGAYGVLMETDEDSQRFCEEDIDQILSRRTQVIRHGEDAASRPQETSLFSKATFAATADDFDIDMDDPNFWELWAKRSNLNTKELLSGAGVAVDEPRIRRQARRLKEVDIHNIELPKVDEEEEIKGNLWNENERNMLLELLLKFGPNRLDKILPAFDGRRSRNDIVACIRALIKFCLENNSSTDRFFKEDSEKLMLSNLDFERDDRQPVVDDSTGKIDLGAAEFDESSNLSSSDQPDEPQPQLAKGDKPYPGANKEACVEFASFLKQAPESWLEAVKSIGQAAVLRMQLVDFLRDMVESNGTAKGLPVPPLPGATPAEGWNRKDDEGMLMAAYEQGYGTWFRDAESTKEDADFEELGSRLSKLVMAMVKKSQAAAKVAMHQATAFVKSSKRRRKAARGSDEENSSSSEGDDDDDEVLMDEDEEIEEDQGKSKRKSTRKPQTKEKSPEAVKTTVYWSKRDQQEFFLILRGYGLPPKDPESGKRDWTTFCRLGKFSPAVLQDSSTSFEEFSNIFVGALESASHVRRRRRTKKEMEEGVGKEDLDEVPGELFPSDENGATIYGDAQEDLDEIEDEKKANKGLTVVPIIAPARAKSILARIQFLENVRSLDLSDEEAVIEKASHIRRTGSIPSWWKSGLYDLALIRAVQSYGCEAFLNQAIDDPNEQIHQLLLQDAIIKVASGVDTDAEKETAGKRRSARSEAAKFHPSFDIHFEWLEKPLDFLNNPAIFRLPKIVDLIQAIPAPAESEDVPEVAEAAPPKKRAKATSSSPASKVRQQTLFESKTVTRR